MQLELVKYSHNYLRPERLASQIDRVASKVTGWTVSRKGPALAAATNGKLSYKCEMRLVPNNPAASESEALTALKRAANHLKWELQNVPESLLEYSDGDVLYKDLSIPTTWRSSFQHLYGLNDQIDIIMSSVQAAIDSHWQNRYHCALVGPPASGKTETARSFRNLFGDESILEYDATSTTMAGAIKDLASRKVLPRLLVVEEIEKADEAAFRWLLGVMDWRAEIHKVTARSTIHKECRMLGIVTVNDYQHFSRIMSGALASRCGDPIWFPKPTREVLKRILAREVKKVRGNADWIEPALRYAAEAGMTDPRHVAAICLRGKDDLLSGVYQKKLRNSRMPGT